MNACYLHPDKPATVALNVPCAPGGKIEICALCALDQDIATKVWDRYKLDHAKRIAVFKGICQPDRN